MIIVTTIYNSLLSIGQMGKTYHGGIAVKDNHRINQNKLQIRNSTAEFLIFTSQANENTIEVRVEDETVWLTQKLIAELFGVDLRTVNDHLKNIYAEGELVEEATIRKNRIVQKEGNREVRRDVLFYNLDAIISVGYRVNSFRATQFRQWATGVLRTFAIRGYVLDKNNIAEIVQVFYDCDRCRSSIIWVHVPNLLKLEDEKTPLWSYPTSNPKPMVYRHCHLAKPRKHG